MPTKKTAAKAEKKPAAKKAEGKLAPAEKAKKKADIKAAAPPPKAKKVPAKKEPKLPPVEDRQPKAEQFDPRTIRLDGQTQFRVSHSNHAIEDYADRMQAGDKFPPVKVVVDSEGNRWPFDGHHTVLAAIKAGRALVEVLWIPGSRRDAQYLALAANRTNGLHRTREDIRKAATAMLTDPEWTKMGNRAIARHLGVSDPFIGKMRGELKLNQDAHSEQTGGKGQAELPGVGDAGKVAEDNTAPAPDLQLSEEERQKLNDAAASDTATEKQEQQEEETGGGAQPPTEQEQQAQGEENEEHPLGEPAPGGSTDAPTPGAKPRPDNRTDEQRRADAAKWVASHDNIGGILGKEFTEAMASGRINLSEQDVISYGQLPDEELKKALRSMLNNWPFNKHQRIVQGFINGDSKLFDVVNRAIGEGGSYSLELNGYNISVTPKEEDSQG